MGAGLRACTLAEEFVDSIRFDHLTKVFSGSTRRGLLRVLALLAAILAGTASDADEIAAQRRRRGRRRGHRPGNDKDNRKGKRKRKRQRRRKRRRRSIGAPNGSCGTCPDGETCCTGACVNLQTDNFNCGSCDNVCPIPSLTCIDGTCACPNEICATECCPNAHDVCNPNTGECCSPKTCEDFPPNTCGRPGDGCGGVVECPCCPGTPCSCPAGRTLCDNVSGPVVYCLESSCGCVALASGGESICYSGGVCYQDQKICSTDQDCEDQGFPGMRCVLAGNCGLGCVDTACVVPCTPDTQDATLAIDVRTAPTEP